MTFFARMMTPTAPMTAMISVFKFSSGCVTAEVPVPAAKQVMLMSTTCFAAGTGTSAVTQPLENLKTLIIAVIGAVGVIILAKNVMEFAQAYQQQWFYVKI